MSYATEEEVKRRHPHGLPARLLAFYEANPDEELTYSDIVAKFSVSPFTAREAVKALRSQIESVHIVRLRAKGIAA